MAKTLRDGMFACSVCGEKYSSPQHADACRDAHNLLYIPMTKDELNLLLNSIYIGNFSILPVSLIETLKKYARQAVVKVDGPSDKVSRV